MFVLFLSSGLLLIRLPESSNKKDVDVYQIKF